MADRVRGPGKDSDATDPSAGIDRSSPADEVPLRESDVAPPPVEEDLRAEPLDRLPGDLGRADPASLGSDGPSHGAGIDGPDLGGLDRELSDRAAGLDVGPRGLDALGGDPTEGGLDGDAGDPVAARQAAFGAAGDTSGGGPTPIPYPNSGGGSGDGRSHGDEAGTLGGMVRPSTTMEDAQHTLAFSKVKVEGQGIPTGPEGTDGGGGGDDGGTTTGGTDGGGATPDGTTGGGEGGGEGDGGGQEGDGGGEGDTPPEGGTDPVEDQAAPGEGGGFGAGAHPVAPIDVNDFVDAPHTGWGDGVTDPGSESDGYAQIEGEPVVDDSVRWDVSPDSAPVDDADLDEPEPDEGDIDWGDG